MMIYLFDLRTDKHLSRIHRYQENVMPPFAAQPPTAKLFLL